MLRFLSWAALLLGLLILLVYALIYVELIRTTWPFGMAMFLAVLDSNLHLLAGPGVGLALVACAGWGFARTRRA